MLASSGGLVTTTAPQVFLLTALDNVTITSRKRGEPCPAQPKQPETSNGQRVAYRFCTRNPSSVAAICMTDLAMLIREAFLLYPVLHPQNPSKHFIMHTHDLSYKVSSIFHQWSTLPVLASHKPDAENTIRFFSLLEHLCQYLLRTLVLCRILSREPTYEVGEHSGST